MKNILGHKSWNQDEVLAFFDKGSFTMCNLPHYRFQRVKQICSQLARCGFIKKVGGDDTNINYVPTPKYHEWRTQVKQGLASCSLNKAIKAVKPAPKVLHHKCKHCGEQYEIMNWVQKFCSKQCKSKHNLAQRV